MEDGWMDIIDRRVDGMDGDGDNRLFYYLMGFFFNPLLELGVHLYR